MRRLILFLFIILLSCSLFSQNNLDNKTILFFIPFATEHVNEIRVDEMTIDHDIYKVPSFELVGFWEGAQLALKEFEDQGVSLNVIVVDITDNEQKLKNILKDTTLMRDVDLIIGPFYAPLFEIAAKYSAIYEIPIVNPFSNRTDFLHGNPFVYKLIPATGSRFPLLKQLVIDKHRDKQVILYVENEKHPDSQLYVDFFNQENIPFIKIPFQEEASNLIKQLSDVQHNIVVVLAQSVETIIANIRSLSSVEIMPPSSYIIPEKWLSDLESELIDFNRLEVLFFSNYHVDRYNEKRIYFDSEFIEQFLSPPDINRFSYQGYDITRYFVNYLLHDFDTTRFEYTPISFDFYFQKIEHGGYENQRSRLLQLIEFDIIEEGMWEQE